MKITRFLLLLLTLGAVCPVSAAIVTIQAEGVVDSYTFSGKFDSDGSVSIGTPITAICVYDTDAPALESDAWHATYTVLSASMQIGNYTFTPYPDTAATFRVGTTDPSHSISTQQLSYNGTVYFNGEPTTRNELPELDYEYIKFFGLLYSTTTDPTFTNELPTTFGDISDVVSKQFKVSMYHYQGSYPDWVVSRFSISGELTSIEVVPEPTTLMLMLCGGLALRKKRK